MEGILFAYRLKTKVILRTNACDTFCICLLTQISTVYLSLKAWRKCWPVHFKSLFINPQRNQIQSMITNWGKSQAVVGRFAHKVKRAKSKTGSVT